MRIQFSLVLAIVVLAGAAHGDVVDDAKAKAQSGDVKGAIELATKAIDADGKDPRARQLRARLYEREREFEKAIEDYDNALKSGEDIETLFGRANCHLRAGNIEKSVADFDRFVQRRPAAKPYLWQRGIALYYAGKFDEGAKQFEIHQTVNSNDVENAAWHYLCVARSSGVEKARESLIAIRGDKRIPLMKIHEMYSGRAKPEDVLAAATAGDPDESKLNLRLFYAHLYIGLFHEAAGEKELAHKHIKLAAQTHTVQDYMGDVARVHVKMTK